MGIKIYDDAIVKKFKKWWPDKNLRILKPNETNRLWGILANENNDEPLTLPLLSISRDPSIGLDIAGRRSLSCDGIKLDGSESETLQLNAIPISITYQIDIYTQKYEDGDTILRALVLNLVNHPKMKVLIPYNDVQIKHVANLWIDGDLTDNSDIPEKKFPDQFTRWTIRVAVHDAFLFSVPVAMNSRLIGAERQIKDKQPGDDIVEVVYSSIDSDSDDDDTLDEDNKE